MTAGASDATSPFRPELEIDGPPAQRRWTVLIRFILLVPHLIVLHFVWLAANVVAVVGWFAALFLGRLPDWIADFLALYVSYEARVGAYELLLVDHYPPFVVPEPGYPVRTDLRARPQNRLTVLFRLILVIPAAIVVVIISYGWMVLAFFLWLAVLIAGRTPRPVFDGGAAFLRFAYRTRAYLYLLTSAYPSGLFGDLATAGDTAESGTRPLVLSRGGRILLIAFLVLGVLSMVAGGVFSALVPPKAYHHGDYTWVLGR